MYQSFLWVIKLWVLSIATMIFDLYGHRRSLLWSWIEYIFCLKNHIFLKLSRISVLWRYTFFIRSFMISKFTKRPLLCSRSLDINQNLKCVLMHIFYSCFIIDLILFRRVSLRTIIMEMTVDTSSIPDLNSQTIRYWKARFININDIETSGVSSCGV